ncbi:hypothetical protein EHH60_14060 [Bradyrhizobium sp. RP6]|nr:hypothetical protein EHH60_14060 [Bradyrhizobium sp. RP6]
MARWRAHQQADQAADPERDAGEALRALRPLLPPSLSFRGDAKHRTPVRNCAPENLEIPGSVLRAAPE